jgi:hypothetical protein
MTAVEPVEFRTGQRAQWNIAAAGWKNWAPIYPPDVQGDAWAAIADAARERAGGDRPFTISNRALLAAGET